MLVRGFTPATPQSTKKAPAFQGEQEQKACKIFVDLATDPNKLRADIASPTGFLNNDAFMTSLNKATTDEMMAAMEQNPITKASLREAENIIGSKNLEKDVVGFMDGMAKGFDQVMTGILTQIPGGIDAVTKQLNDFVKNAEKKPNE